MEPTLGGYEKKEYLCLKVGKTKQMGKRLKKLKKIRLHHEGTHTLVWTLCALLALNGLVYLLFSVCLLFKVLLFLSIILYAVLLNFFQCPIRLFSGETDGVVVAPADGKIVVVEEVEENEIGRASCRERV